MRKLSIVIEHQDLSLTNACYVVRKQQMPRFCLIPALAADRTLRQGHKM